MIDRIILKNFQRHERLVIDLDSRVTCLTGRTDAGKSAVLRAVHWLSRNRPAGDACKRNGADFVSVRINIDGRKVIRRRGNGDNLYQLDSERFVSFGQDVPVPVADFLNLGSVNFSGQHAGPFWFCLNAGEVSRELNAVVNLDLIDAALSKAGAGVRQAEAELTVSETRRVDAAEKVKRLTWIPDAVSALSEVERLYSTWQKIAQDRVGLTTLIDDVKRHADASKQATRAIPALATAVRLGEKVIELHKRIEVLCELINRVRQARLEKVQAGQRARVAEYEVGLELSKGCPACGRVPT